MKIKEVTLVTGSTLWVICQVLKGDFKTRLQSDSFTFGL